MRFYKKLLETSFYTRTVLAVLVGVLSKIATLPAFFVYFYWGKIVEIHAILESSTLAAASRLPEMSDLVAVSYTHLTLPTKA